jgi:hypothetical protein
MRHRIPFSEANILDNSLFVVPSAYCLVPSLNDFLQLTTDPPWAEQRMRIWSCKNL